MTKTLRKTYLRVAVSVSFLVALSSWVQRPESQIGREVAVPAHLQDGDEFNIPLAQLIGYGRRLFDAKFTVQEGAGRPMSKGTRERNAL